MLPRPLLFALLLSGLLHSLSIAAPWLLARWLTPEAVRPPPPLQARLQPPPAPRAPAPPPELIAPKAALSAPAEPEKRPARTVDRKPSPGQAPAARTWTQHVREQFAEQQRQGLFYPEEAIRRGLQGEPVVLIMLSPEGQVVAARIEESSGHPLLDEAALRAVRALRTLPADAPREVLLPVRFRLR